MLLAFKILQGPSIILYGVLLVLLRTCPSKYQMASLYPGYASQSYFKLLAIDKKFAESQEHLRSSITMDEPVLVQSLQVHEIAQPRCHPMHALPLMQGILPHDKRPRVIFTNCQSN
jgi:hypothetical protein